MKHRKLRLLLCCLTIGVLASGCKTITCGCPMAGGEMPEYNQHVLTRQTPEEGTVAPSPQKTAVLPRTR